MTLAPSPTPLFQLDAITFRYPQSLALDSLSLEIVRGQRIAFLGANGSGKSTLLRLLAALQFPESGSLRFEGELLGEDRFADDDFAYAFRRRVGLVFQDSDAQLFNPTVYDEIAFGPLQLDLPKNEVRSRVDRMLEQFGIGDLAKRIPHHLSGGEKRKVALASILVMSPEVILLDEPTAGLDPRSQTQLVDLLMSWSDQSKTIIVATHDLHMLEDLADECRILERGRLVGSGSPTEVLSNRPLLERANLIHAHRHSHLGVPHAHHGPHADF